MLVNPDVDGHSKTLNHRKILRKTQENNDLLKTKRIVKPRYKLSGAWFLHLACQGGRFAPLHLRSVTPMNLSSNKFKYMDLQIVCKDEKKRHQCCFQNTSENKIANLQLHFRIDLMTI